jgi:hypothetical protein
MIFHFRINEHQVDSTAGREREEGLKILRRVISEYYKLEKELKTGLVEEPV